MEHLPLLLGLLLLGLIIFGPKKMIEMGGRLGEMLRELRSAVKEMNWSVLGDDAQPNRAPTTLGKLSQLAQDLTTPAATPPSPPAAVESAPPPVAVEPVVIEPVVIEPASPPVVVESAPPPAADAPPEP